MENIIGTRPTVWQDYKICKGFVVTPLVPIRHTDKATSLSNGIRYNVTELLPQ
jgi:hypothetical protein